MAERVRAIIKATRQACRRGPGTGCPGTPTTVASSVASRPRDKFNSRYATLGFSDEANLDDGAMWPVGFALTESTLADEARIAALVKKAVS